jgi:hypothetical protein
MAEGNGADLPVTPAFEFRSVRERGEKITIKSTGRIVRMRTVKPAYLLRLGKIPDPLSELVMGILYGKITSAQYEAFFDIAERKENAVELTESLRIVCTAALVEPRIVDDPQADNEIHIDDLEDREQRYIFDLALLEATDLSRFRRQQETDVEPVSQSETNEQQAEPVG